MCDIFWRAEITRQRLELRKPRPDVLAFLGALTHRCCNQTGADHVRTNAAWSVIRSNGTREADDSAFAGGIGMCGKVVIAADQTKHRGNVDDSSTPLR